MKTALTIAGFDPSAGAGVTADLMVFAAHGLHGIAAITALTVQSTLGVRASHAVDPEILRTTLECLDQDIRPSGLKIGMVSSQANLRVISGYLKIFKFQHSDEERIPIVLDPVLMSSSGRELLDPEGFAGLKESLLPLVDWVTPNTDELSRLTGLGVGSHQDLAIAARQLQGQVGRRIGVFAKGGHLENPDDLLLMPNGEEHWLAGERIETNSTHGTGCALSSAFLSRLVLGDDPLEAAHRAKDYVASAMRKAPGVGNGKGPLGLLWPLSGQQRG
ncbi:MAG TPA: bifunctional hydroxymethylpyrimidine kinase/phosphomethylpyrimidine kinase [Acidobacteriaceae bacterium]|nr:bifunctional hydroxymethylpyrimidine kinase/phosphomethylpyrimidine kinase [Acidobacteriaceae bacterium]